MEYDWVAIVFLPILFLMLFAYIRSMGRYWWWLSTSNIVIYYLAALLISTFVIGADFEHGIYWFNTVVLGTTALIAGCLFASLRNGVTTYKLAHNFYNKPIDHMFSKRSLVLVWGILVFGTIVIVLYLKAIQGNVFMNIVKEGIAVNSINVVDIRKKAVYGSGFGSGDYMAAGYVMQFRSFLLPIIMLVCLGHYFMQRRKKFYLLCLIVISGLISTFANGATGQRGTFCTPFIICAYLCFISYYCKPSQFSKKTQMKFKAIFITSLVLGFTFFGILTFALGRKGHSEKKNANLINVAVNLTSRIFIVPVEKDLEAIEILKEYPPSLGRNYIQGILKVLPNQIEHRITKNWSEVGTSNWLHVQHGGSKEGNAPLNLWGAFWFNFRLPGVLIGGFIVGFLCQCYDRWSFKRRKTVLSVVCWQFGAISLALASSLGQILLTGFAAAMMLLWLNGLFERGILANMASKHISHNKDMSVQLQHTKH